jgi:hypothetical protein
MQKAPTWRANYRCFEPPTSKFISAHLARMVSVEDARNYTCSSRTSLRLVQCCSCYRLCVCSRGYKWEREGRDPKSLVSVSNGVELLSHDLRALGRLQNLLPLMGRLAFPFIGQQKGRGYTRERRREGRKRRKRKSREEGSPRATSLFFPDRQAPMVL